MTDLGQLAAIGAAVVVILGGIVGAWLKYGRPRWSKAVHFVARVDETINGRPAEVDAYGRERAPEIPALADQHAVMAQQLGQLTTAVQALVTHTERLDGIGTHVDDLDRRVVKLEEASIERTVARADSALGWAAVKAAIEADALPKDAAEPPALDEPDLD